MKNIILSVALGFGVFGGVAHGDEPLVEKKITKHILAQLGDTKETENRIYVYSKAALKEVRFSGNQKHWDIMKQVEKQGDYFIFSTPSFPELDADQVLYVLGLVADGSLFTDAIHIVEKSGKLDLSVEGISEMTAEENFNSKDPKVTRHEIFHGGATLPPKTVARARVMYMAHVGAGVHFGSAGALMTTVGALSEGWGSGSYTCTGAGPCYADEWAVGPYGSHHLRFYRGGTWSGGGGGRRGFRR